ncbi:hypothetical protein P3T27_007964 [Kitasatospora sp. MAA19]|uniref:hypothetical protein n=1 Tax=unclassified Kitasatospora TaxID=2633591 RepID=UPI002473D400|nr:hypothetical protein [Kitasatospora sp. MAA19]MDH6711211.1 hypothetical protein [Kitasatospora sp. MAA19]
MMADRHDRAARRARLRLIAIGVVTAAAVAAGSVALVNGLSDGDNPKPTPAPTVAATVSPGPVSSPSPSATRTLTPNTAKPVHLIKPTGQKDGASIGFPRYGYGPMSAAVYHLDELSMLDDDMVRRQLTVITAKGSEDSIDKAVSEVRKLREQVGLPPSGGTPAGLTITTTVDAAQAWALNDDGSVITVWMHYSRTATLPKGGPDDNPLKDQLANMILQWEDGDWKITTDPKWVAKKGNPMPYNPDSPVSAKDGWGVVIRD